MKIRVKVACSCLTLSKKPPPLFFKSWLRAWKHQKLLIAIFVASLENLKDIANRIDSIGVALN